MTTCGLPGNDGCHYSHEGYFAMAEIIFPFVTRDFYNKEYDRIITPPKLISVYYSRDFDGNSVDITLQFDQELVWEDKLEVNGKTHYMKDQFFFRKNRNDTLITDVVRAGRVEGEKIVLEIGTKEQYNYISYLPSKFYVGTEDVYN